MGSTVVVSRTRTTEVMRKVAGGMGCHVHNDYVHTCGRAECLLQFGISLSASVVVAHESVREVVLAIREC